MALSTPPPPPEPPSSSSTTTTTNNNNNSVATTRPLFPPNPRPPPPPPNNHSLPYYSTTPLHPPHSNSRLPSNPNPNYAHLVPSPQPPEIGTITGAAAAILYPVASSGRGFLSKQTATATLTNPLPNSPLYQARPGVSYPRQPFGYSHPDPSFGPGLGYVTGRPTHLQHATVVGNAPGGVMPLPGVIRGVPLSAVSSQSQYKIALSPASVSDSNGHKDLGDRSKDDAFVTIRDRKVRISDNASVYALCRSWLRNGFPEESQLPYQENRSLPRPLPLSSQDITSPAKKEDDKEVEEGEESVDHLSPEELLQRYIKRAKRVRSRLREERLRRIARYKTRLALLLPPMVDPHLRNDLATGN